MPEVKEWRPETVVYRGQLVTHDGALWQARCDTAQQPGRSEWTLVARAGRDAVSPKMCGAYDTTTKYRAFDCVLFGDSTYIAMCDAPGLPFDRGWQLLAGHGQRGMRGERGPQGQRGEKGDPGPTPPTIARWRIDRENYRATPVMTDGELGSPLELRELFETFLAEVA